MAAVNDSKVPPLPISSSTNKIKSSSSSRLSGRGSRLSSRDLSARSSRRSSARKQPGSAGSLPSTGRRSTSGASTGRKSVVTLDHDPLVKAAKAGNAAALKEILQNTTPKHRLELVNAIDKNGSTPIFHPVWPGHLEALEVLLNYGADANIQNLRRNTALHLACERYGASTDDDHKALYKKIIKTLIEHDAQIDIENWEHKMCWEKCEDEELMAEIEEWVKGAKADYDARVLAALSRKITDEEKSRFKAIFDTVDADDDGKIQLVELQPFLSSMVVGAPEPEDIKRFFDWFDSEDQGGISFLNFMFGVLKCQRDMDSVMASLKKGKGKGKGRKGRSKSPKKKKKK